MADVILQTNLSEVQKDVRLQLQRDYQGRSFEELRDMCLAGLVEEVGEVMGIHKRRIRLLEKDKKHLTHEHHVEELGDVLWYLVAYCDVCGIDLEGVWQYNKAKLEEHYG